MFSNKYIAHYKSTISLALPISISQLGHIMVSFVDTAMVGHIGTTEQAAVALANVVFILVLVFAIGFSFGLTPLVAIASGSNDESEKRSWLANGLFGNLLLACFLCIVLFLISPIISHLDQPLDVVKKAIPFLSLLILSLIPLSLFSTVKQFAEGLSQTKPAMYASIGGNLLNIILNYILIFGEFGFEPMGYIGSAYATLISRVIMGLAMLLYLMYGKHCKKIVKGLKANLITVSRLKQLYQLSIPTGLQFFFEVGAFSVAAVMTGWLGTKALAAHQIALTTAAGSYMIASGIGAAATIRVGNSIGANDTVGVKHAGYSAMFLSLMFMGFMAILFILFNNQIAFLFTKDAEVQYMVAKLMLIAALFQLADGAQVVCLGALRGLKDVKIPTLITLIAYWFITLATCYLLGIYLKYGVYGIWYGFVIGLFFVAVLLLWRFEYVRPKEK